MPVPNADGADASSGGIAGAGAGGLDSGQPY